MKNILRLISILIVFLTLTGITFSQTAISEAKRKLIEEIVVETKMDTQMSSIMDVVLAQEEKTYSATVKDLVEKQTGLNPDQKVSFEKELVEKHEQFSDDFRKRLKEKIDYKLLIQETVYPLYDKFFSENELRDLRDFYRSPTGKKTLEVMPQMMTESIDLMTKSFLPKVTAIVEDLVNEDLKNVTSAPPPKKVNK